MWRAKGKWVPDTSWEVRARARGPGGAARQTVGLGPAGHLGHRLRRAGARRTGALTWEMAGEGRGGARPRLEVTRGVEERGAPPSPPPGSGWAGGAGRGGRGGARAGARRWRQSSSSSRRRVLGVPVWRRGRAERGGGGAAEGRRLPHPDRASLLLPSPRQQGFPAPVCVGAAGISLFTLHHKVKSFFLSQVKITLLFLWVIEFSLLL
jgi:hypothetical protein